MTTHLTFDGLNPFDDPVDRILAEIALRKRRRISESTRRHLWGIPKTGVAL